MVRPHRMFPTGSFSSIIVLKKILIDRYRVQPVREMKIQQPEFRVPFGSMGAQNSW